jgi:hypothetical protein
MAGVAVFRENGLNLSGKVDLGHQGSDQQEVKQSDSHEDKEYVPGIWISMFSWDIFGIFRS